MQSSIKIEQDVTQKQDSECEKQEKPYSYEKYLQISKLLKQLHIKDSNRTTLCRHQNGCFYNVLNQAFKAFALGYSANLILKIVQLFLNLKKAMRNPVNSLFFTFISKDSFRFGLFPAVYNLVLSSTQCGMRRTELNQSLQCFISGFLAGLLSLATRQKGNRQIWGIFLLSRSLDCIYRSLCNKNYIKKSPHHYTFLFMILYLLLGYAYGNEPQILPQSFNKFLRGFSHEDDNELIHRKLMVQIADNKLIAQGFEATDINKYMFLKQNK